jgi:uncharacterized protein
MLSRLLIIGVRGYQKFISPIKPKKIKCRFHPTCSQYAIDAIRKYGAIKGVKKTINRLKRCNPYNRDSCIDYP